MALTIVAEAENGFSVQGDLTAKTVMSAWPERNQVLQGAAQNGHALTLDLTDVVHVDTAGLAWLVQLVSQCAEQKIALTIQNLPESLQKLAKISDVERLLPLQ